VPEKFKNYKNTAKKKKLRNLESYFYSTPYFSNNVNRVYKMTKNHYFVRLQNNQTILVFRNMKIFRIGTEKDTILFGKILKKKKKEDIILYTNNRQYFTVFDAKARKKLLTCNLVDYHLECSVIKAVEDMDNLDLISVRIGWE
jgi:hypothetical protein